MDTHSGLLRLVRMGRHILPEPTAVDVETAPPGTATSEERVAWEKEHTTGVTAIVGSDPSQPMPLRDGETEPGTKFFGNLIWSASDDKGAWSNKMLPICVVHGEKQGRGVLLLAGNHGDEYESQIAVQKLCRSVDPADVCGRLIMIPTVSLAAAMECRRTWPPSEYGSENVNFNRVFPGADTGGPATQLAYYISHVLMPIVDVVMDVHTGGSSMRIEPSSLATVNPAHPRHRERMEAMLAFMTPLSFVWTTPAHGEKTVGILPDEAVTQGKVVVETELGGGTYCPATGHHIAQRGVTNVLRNFGCLIDEPPTTREALGLPPTTIVFADQYIPAPVRGFWETAVDPGERVKEGQVLGRISFPEELEREPHEVLAPYDGVCIGSRAIVPTRPGDVLVTYGREVTKQAIMDGTL